MKQDRQLALRIEGNPLAAPARPRPEVRGKFLYAGDEKLYVRGVTYGTFRPCDDGSEYGEPATVERDFAQMAANGINAVRVYSVPPRWLLNLALDHGLRVMIGLPWEQHVTFLDDRERMASIEERVREGVRQCAGHPAVLCFAIGNEIPGPIVRWHGARRVERFLNRLYRVVKREDPGALVTYVNFPTTEYLQLPFLDFVSFNVYLESQDRLESYLARLQNVAGDRPLVMAEIGLDSRGHGLRHQADVLKWQIESTFAAGATGIFVFAWTDEWYRGGFDIEDWDFGLVTRDGKPKPALRAVRKAFGEIPFPAAASWPRVSVVVCSYNGSSTLADCWEGIARLDYPNYEAILVDDGSTDDTALIGQRSGLRVIRTKNEGLSAARNTGYRAATGEIVAYIDDDARPDPQWLRYLAHAFQSGDFAGVGGPNIAPAGDGRIADCVANAPGGPVHVLLTDQIAEHIPGCNMAFRKSALEAIEGFDPIYRAAGDDVDLCWRLQEMGWTVGFSGAAVVWHHRRNSLRAYWKQQCGYGKAEALLERKWPEKYNAAGHLAWEGRVYSKGLTQALPVRGRVYGGVWGRAPFQRLYESAPGTLRLISLMPEWYLLLGVLAVLSVLSRTWSPLFPAIPLLAGALLLPAVQAALSAARAQFTTPQLSLFQRTRMYALTACLHLVQPVARLWGRTRHGLNPWRLHVPRTFVLPVPRTVSLWRESWLATDTWLQRTEGCLRHDGAVLRPGGSFDRWDLHIRGGAFGAARLRCAIEEHGAGKQLARYRIWPHVSPFLAAVAVCFLALFVEATLSHAVPAAVVCGVAAAGIGARMVHDVSCSMASAVRAVARLQQDVN